MKLYFIRHGQTIDNLAGRMQGQRHGKLTELGIKQAKKLAKRLQNERFDVVYCSNLGRAVETALAFIELDQNFPIVYTPELREKNIGSYSGLTAEEADEHDAEFGLFTDLESEQEFYDRGGRFLDFILQNHNDDEKILVIAHCAINQRIVGNMFGLTPEESRLRPGQKNAALSIFEKSDTGWKTIVENEVGYLEELPIPQLADNLV